MNGLSIKSALAVTAFIMLAQPAAADKMVPLRGSEYDRWEQYLPDYRKGRPYTPSIYAPGINDEPIEERYRLYDERYRPYYDTTLGDHEWEKRSYLKQYKTFDRGYGDVYLNDRLIERPSYVWPDTGLGPRGFGTGDWR